MKLSPSALAILLSASPTAAFAPSLHIHHTTPFRTSLSVGGAAPPPPPEGSSSEEEEQQQELPISVPSEQEQLAQAVPSDSSPPPRPGRRYLDYAAMEEYLYNKYGTEDILKTMGVNSYDEVDPSNPDIYIKPRPGKYGWKPIELTKEYLRAQDKINCDPENLLKTDNEREENLKEHMTWYQDASKWSQVRDLESANEARMQADYFKSFDPWFDLNERLSDAVKCEDEEDITYLKQMIEQIGGPPPSLKEKVNEFGYVPLNSIYSLTLSNERLEELIRQTASDKYAEYNRKVGLYNKLLDIEEGKYGEDRVAEEEWVRQAQASRYRSQVAWLAEKRKVADAGRVQARKEAMDKDRKKLIEKWKALGYDETPEEYFSDIERRQSNLSDKISALAKEQRRADTLYEEEEEMEFDDWGTPVDDIWENTLPKSHSQKYLEQMEKEEANGRPRVKGDQDVFDAELDPNMEIKEGSVCTTGPLTVEVNSCYNAEQSDPPGRKHCFQYTVRITNNSEKDTVQLLSRKFYIQTLASKWKDIVSGEGVTGRQPVLKPGEVFEYTSTAPLSTRPLGGTIIAARMSGEYRYCTLNEGQETATEEQINNGKGEAGAEMAMFHFVFPEDQRVQKWWSDDEDLDDDEDDADAYYIKQPKSAEASAPPAATDAKVVEPVPKSPPTSLPGDPDITSGNISGTPNDSSDTVTSDVRVVVTSKYVPERSDPATSRYCFAYSVKISNESKDRAIQLVSRRFEIQNIGSQTKDVVQGANVTGRQPVLKPGENFEYTSSAPLAVTPMLDKTRVLSRMCGEYNCVQLADDGVTPISSTPLKAEMGTVHFILPEEQQ